MPHPLDGSKLKVIRAQEHLDSLKTEIRRYLKDQPSEAISYGTDHPDALFVIHNFPDNLSFPSPPVLFSAIIGDCVTNARAALDYIMWELAQRYLTPPVDIHKRDDRRITA